MLYLRRIAAALRVWLLGPDAICALCAGPLVNHRHWRKSDGIGCSALTLNAIAEYRQRVLDGEQEHAGGNAR